MRIVSESQNTRVLAIDEQGQGGACHEYVVEVRGSDCWFLSTTRVLLQNGPVKEFGINGCTNENLLEIVEDRLKCFQAGSFACRENESALVNVQLALGFLKSRTKNREERGVEGTNVL